MQESRAHPDSIQSGCALTRQGGFPTSIMQRAAELSAAPLACTCAYLFRDNIAITRRFCSGVTFATTLSALLCVLSGSRYFDDPLNPLAFGDQLRIVQRLLDRLLQDREPRLRRPRLA